jgi:hypothetical protein
MNMRNRTWQLITIVFPIIALVVVGCGGGTSQVSEIVGPQEIANATEVLKFDPSGIPLDGRDPVSGTCGALSAVPGTYFCVLDGGGSMAPCFALAGERLLCDPNPVSGTYQTLVSPDAPLPAVLPPSPDQAEVFFVELDGSVRTCVTHSGIEPVIIAGVVAQFDCDAPFTYLLGIEKSTPIWEAALYTLDPATGNSPSGKVPVDVVRAWIP